MIFMISGKLLRKDPTEVVEKTKLEHKVMLAKRDPMMRNDLIKKYQPFIAKVTSKVCKQYINYSRDEYSVALEAFNEAIDHFQDNQGSSFLSFADMVIRRRVIDFIRKETRQTRGIFLEHDSHDDEYQQESLAQVNASLAHYTDILENERRRADIIEYQQELSKFNITFSELAGLCPKHMDARENAKQIAKLLADHDEMMHYLIQKKQLPMNDLIKSVRCSRKTIERNRKYIIAMALIYQGDYHALRSYIEPLKTIEKGGKRVE